MKTTLLARYSRVALVLGSLLFIDARAADDTADGYIVMSSIGDALTIVTYSPTVGSRLDSNLKEIVPLTDHQFDRQASAAAGAAIRRGMPGAAVQVIESSTSVAFDGTDEELASDGARAALLDSIRSQSKNDARYLVVIGKHRGDARLKMAHTTVGSGKLAGLGFYLDRSLRVADARTGNRGTGFVAPYAYVSATLVDLRTGSIVRSRSVQESMSVATAHSSTAIDPWEALTADQKVRMINVLVRRAVDDMLPKLVAPE